MSDLSQALRKLIELPDSRAIDDRDHNLICKGEAQENARLRPVLLALCECVEALRTEHDEQCMDQHEEFGPDETCECGAIVAQQALARLTEAVKECE